ncbi:MAG: HNH endonuclease [Glutamicibacter sp.]|uniref:HNH endonuclease n=1 Tax=Glutamicibacter sp. TaxID=1931995 RepID=UPI002FC98439
MAIKQLPPLSTLDRLFGCNPETGVLCHRVVRGAGRKGAVVGTPNKHGYLVATIDYKHYLVHRIVWAMAKRQDPGSAVIDHVNGITDDNRISNLRLADQVLNGLNARLSKRNKSGFKGVYYDRSKRLWRASICNRFIGRFRTIEEAAEAYRLAALELGGNFARFE